MLRFERKEKKDDGVSEKRSFKHYTIKIIL